MISFLFPTIAEAATPPIPPSVLVFVGKISTNILNPIIALLFALAVVFFLWGLLGYLWNPDNEEMREKGRGMMIWGIVGMFIMVTVFSIMRLLISSIGADPNLMNYV